MNTSIVGSRVHRHECLDCERIGLRRPNAEPTTVTLRARGRCDYPSTFAQTSYRAVCGSDSSETPAIASHLAQVLLALSVPELDLLPSGPLRDGAGRDAWRDDMSATRFIFGAVAAVALGLSSNSASAASTGTSTSSADQRSAARARAMAQSFQADSGASPTHTSRTWARRVRLAVHPVCPTASTAVG